MSGGVADDVTADVLLVVEQLRRPVPGGIGTYVSGLVTALAAEPEATPSVRLVASRGPHSDPLARLGLPLSTSALPGAVPALWPRLGVGPRTPGSLRHATSFALPAGRAPLVVTVHDLAFLNHRAAYPARGRRWHERALRRALEEARAFVVPSRPVADALVGLGVKAQAVSLIEEGADHLPPPDVSGARGLLDRLGVGESYLLSVSTLEPRKNLERLIGAYSSVREGLPGRPELVVVGPAGWGAKVVPAEGVHLLGAVAGPVLSALYGGAGLFCYVPLEEGFGLPVVEAMTAGAPVLSSAVPAAGGATHLVDPLDVAGIAAGIVEVLSTSARRAELAAAGRRRVEPLTWRRTASEHRELWRSLLESDR